MADIKYPQDNRVQNADEFELRERKNEEFSSGALGVIEKVNYLLSFTHDDALIEAINLVNKALPTMPELDLLKKTLDNLLSCQKTVKTFIKTVYKNYSLKDETYEFPNYHNVKV